MDNNSWTTNRTTTWIPKNSTCAEKSMPLILELDFDDEWTMQTDDLPADMKNVDFFVEIVHDNII